MSCFRAVLGGRSGGGRRLSHAGSHTSAVSRGSLRSRASVRSRASHHSHITRQSLFNGSDMSKMSVEDLQEVCLLRCQSHNMSVGHRLLELHDVRNMVLKFLCTELISDLQLWRGTVI